jgi:hypothetical protein
MTQKRMRHSKFKNTGILFELLARQVTADIIAGHESSIARDLLHKYFKENTTLGKEWQLYTTLINEKIKDDVHAERLLSVVINTRKKLNDKKLSQEKYNLIKEIKSNYPIDEMLKSPVRNYKLLASIYKTFENETSNEIRFDVKESYQAKNCIIESITDKPKASLSDDTLMNHYKTQSEEIRLLSYKLLVEKLNDKYSSTLDDKQKSVLREYICNVANTNQFGPYINEKVKEIKQSLVGLSKKIKNSDVVKIKINEVVNQLDKITPCKIVKDNHVMVLMLSYELLKEVNSQLEEQHVI